MQWEDFSVPPNPPQGLLADSRAAGTVWMDWQWVLKLRQSDKPPLVNMRRLFMVMPRHPEVGEYPMAQSLRGRELLPLLMGSTRLPMALIRIITVCMQQRLLERTTTLAILTQVLFMSKQVSKLAARHLRRHATSQRFS